jgi:hypothetical protein
MLDAARTSSSPFVARSPIGSRVAGQFRPPRSDRAHRIEFRPLAVLFFLSLCGCHVVPSVNVLGSFFPAWLICIVIGVVLTLLIRQLFVAMKIAPHLGPAALVYPSLAAACVFATWLILFES